MQIWKANSACSCQPTRWMHDCVTRIFESDKQKKLQPFLKLEFLIKAFMSERFFFFFAILCAHNIELKNILFMYFCINTNVFQSLFSSAAFTVSQRQLPLSPHCPSPLTDLGLFSLILLHSHFRTQVPAPPFPLLPFHPDP